MLTPIARKRILKCTMVINSYSQRIRAFDNGTGRWQNLELGIGASILQDFFSPALLTPKNEQLDTSVCFTRLKNKFHLTSPSILFLSFLLQLCRPPSGALLSSTFIQ